MAMVITTVGLIGAGVAAAGVGAGLYESSQQQGIENKALGLEESQAGKQNWAFNSLQNLMANPGSFFTSPLFTSTLDVGTKATERAQAAGGYLHSGNEDAALQTYGQSFASGQLLNQEQLLAGMSGTGFNPASALGTASSAGNTSFNQLGTLLASLGQTGALLGGSSTTPSSTTWSLPGSNFDGSGNSVGNNNFGDPASAGPWG